MLGERLELLRSSIHGFNSWLVVEPTHLKNISQIESFPQVGVKIKDIWNHHLEYDWNPLMTPAAFLLDEWVFFWKKVKGHKMEDIHTLCLDAYLGPWKTSSRIWKGSETNIGHGI